MSIPNISSWDDVLVVAVLLLWIVGSVVGGLATLGAIRILLTHHRQQERIIELLTRIDRRAAGLSPSPKPPVNDRLTPPLAPAPRATGLPGRA